MSDQIIELADRIRSLQTTVALEGFAICVMLTGIIAAIRSLRK
jgi:hypothetical protein